MDGRWASLLGLLLATATDANADAPRSIVIVAGPGGIAAELTVDEARSLYSGRRVADRTRTRVVLTDYHENLPIRDRFYQAVAHRNGSQMRAFWTQRTFSGGGRAPMTVRTTDELITVLRTDARTVGFLWADEVTPDLVVVHTIDVGG